MSSWLTQFGQSIMDNPPVPARPSQDWMDRANGFEQFLQANPNKYLSSDQAPNGPRVRTPFAYYTPEGNFAGVWNPSMNANLTKPGSPVTQPAQVSAYTPAPSEGLLGTFLSQMLGRQVNAAPSMLNGGVPAAPIQSAAPQNLGAMLLGMLLGGGMSQGGGYPGALYGSDPQEAFYQHMYKKYQQGQLPQMGTPQTAQTQQPTRPTVPQTGPTYNGKTYYPSPIPGSQNPPGSAKPDNNGVPVYPYPTVPAYQPGSWQMPQIPQYRMPGAGSWGWMHGGWQQQQNPWTGMNQGYNNFAGINAGSDLTRTMWNNRGGWL